MALPPSEDPTEDTMQIDAAQPNAKRLLKQIQSPQGVVPFVGAGLSIPYGLPGWRQFLLNLADQNGELDTVRKLLSDGQYEEAAELLLDAMASRAFDDAVVDAFGEDAIVDPTGTTATSLLPRLSRGPVVTTNFDRVLEGEFTRGTTIRTCRLRCDSRFGRTDSSVGPSISHEGAWRH